MLRYCTNLKTIRYESTNLNRIVADKSHRVIVALVYSDSRKLGYLWEFIEILLLCFNDYDDGWGRF